jgi:hypothetical protein
MRRLVTWAVVGFVTALGVAAVATAVLNRREGPSTVSENADGTPTVTLPRCRESQLALATEILGDIPFVALRHVSGTPCDVGTLTVSVMITDQRGERAPIQGARDALTGEISPGAEILVQLFYQPRCDQKAPLVAEIRAGDLTTTRRLRIQACEERSDVRPH